MTTNDRKRWRIRVGTRGLVRSRWLATLVAFVMACMTQGCATTALVEWAQPGPTTTKIPVRTRGFDGTTSTAYGQPISAELLGKTVCGIVAVVPALAWDLVTMPVQILGGYPPYGDDGASEQAASNVDGS